MLANVSFITAQIAPVRHNHDSALSTAGITVAAVDSLALRMAGIERPAVGFFRNNPQLMGLHIVLTNNSGRSIHLATLRYAKRYRSDKSTIVYRTYPCSFALFRTSQSGLKSGASAILGPAGDATKVLPMRGEMQVDFSSQRYDEIVFSLDAVVFDDGLVIGPDVYDIVRHDSERNRAERMVLETFASRLAEGKQPVIEWLRTVQNDHGSINKMTGQPDFYRQAAIGMAVSLIALLNTMPVERVARDAQSLLIEKSKFVPIHH
ncbi:MAG: hypothetical protein ABI972_17060 [Acidobacteriota bacterium]